jgi:hypothetical protein
VVENGGKLIMNGTAAEPIVCTEKSKVAGSWGGIIMYGDAPIVGAAGVATATAEDGLTNDANTAYTYGGTNAAHNGGTLRYVRVEYAGKKITDGTSEMNGFHFIQWDLEPFLKTWFLIKVQTTATNFTEVR